MISIILDIVTGIFKVSILAFDGTAVETIQPALMVIAPLRVNCIDFTHAMEMHAGVSPACAISDWPETSTQVYE